MVNMNFKNIWKECTFKIKEKPSGRNYRTVSAKLAALRILSRGVTNFPLQLIYPQQIQLARILQYVSYLAMTMLPCNSLLHMLPLKTFDNLSKLYDF